jgi:hypothetical protein
VLTVVATPSPVVPLHPPAVRMGPVGLLIVMTTLGIPGSPASWIPLALKSSHTRLPIPTRSTSVMSTMEPKLSTLPNAPKFERPPLLNCSDPARFEPSVSFAGSPVYWIRNGPGKSVLSTQSPISLVVVTTEAPELAVTVTVAFGIPASLLRASALGLCRPSPLRSINARPLRSVAAFAPELKPGMNRTNPEPKTKDAPTTTEVNARRRRIVTCRMFRPAEAGFVAICQSLCKLSEHSCSYERSFILNTEGAKCNHFPNKNRLFAYLE